MIEWVEPEYIEPTDEIRPDMLEPMSDQQLPDFLFHYASAFLSDQGCDRLDGPPDAVVLAKLPRPVRMAYTLVLLDSEVLNGGFYQWFTNSSGRLVKETLEDLEETGALPQLEIVQQAVALNRTLEERHPFYARRWEIPEPRGDQASMTAFWSDVEETYDKEFDRLSSEYYRAEDENSMWPLLITYVRQHLQECSHSRKN